MEKDIEKLIKEIIKTNEQYLEEFRRDLEEAGLVKKTIRVHLQNVSEYLNDFLAENEQLSMAEGAAGFYLDLFMGDYLIERSFLSGEDCTRKVAASLKKFYKSMLRRGLIAKEDYEDITETIKEMGAEWKAKLDLFQRTGRHDPFAFL